MKVSKTVDKCCECGGVLTQYEVSDNLFAGLNVKEYVCYSCQPIMNDDENFGYPDYNENEFDW